NSGIRSLLSDNLLCPGCLWAYDCYNLLFTSVWTITDCNMSLETCYMHCFYHITAYEIFDLHYVLIIIIRTGSSVDSRERKREREKRKREREGITQFKDYNSSHFQILSIANSSGFKGV
ncbi:hypothetical protein STEG23_013025, partial [Scotinomys teguina]